MNLYLALKLADNLSLLTKSFIPQELMPKFNFSICRSVLEGLYSLGAGKKAFYRLFPNHHVYPDGVSLSNPFFCPRWILMFEANIKRR